MFDGVSFGSGGHPNGRYFLPLAALPMLRHQGSAATVEGLAQLLVSEAVKAAHWVAWRWPGQDCTAPGHPARLAASSDPDSPPGRAAATLDLLADACIKHRAITGQDGLPLARRAVQQALGPAEAHRADDYLRPLLNVRMELDVEGLLTDAPPPAPPPTPGERLAFNQALLDGFAEINPRVPALIEALDALAAADGGDGTGDTTAANAVVHAAVETLIQAGVDLALLQSLADTWTAARPGAPMVRFQAGQGERQNAS